jgi:toxin ParE1/3/4
LTFHRTGSATRMLRTLLIAGRPFTWYRPRLDMPASRLRGDICMPGQTTAPAGSCPCKEPVTGFRPARDFSTSSKPSMASRAERDLVYLDDEINTQHSDAARRWYLGLKEAILRLEEAPQRCPVTRKSDKLRHLLYGHRPHIYRVLEKTQQVEVLHIRHGTRRKFKPPGVR